MCSLQLVTNSLGRSKKNLFADPCLLLSLEFSDQIHGGVFVHLFWKVIALVSGYTRAVWHKPTVYNGITAMPVSVRLPFRATSHGKSDLS